VFCWALLKLVLGLGFQASDADLLSVLWKCFDSTCANGHKGHNRHIKRADKQVCINPFHFALNEREAASRHIFFHGGLAVDQLAFTDTPQWSLITWRNEHGVLEYHFSPVVETDTLPALEPLPASPLYSAGNTSGMQVDGDDDAHGSAQHDEPDLASSHTTTDWWRAAFLASIQDAQHIAPVVEDDVTLFRAPETPPLSVTPPLSSPPSSRSRKIRAATGHGRFSPEMARRWDAQQRATPYHRSAEHTSSPYLPAKPSAMQPFIFDAPMQLDPEAYMAASTLFNMCNASRAPLGSLVPLY
jgi:hypothetical protein